MGQLVDRSGYLFAAGIVLAAAILLYEVFMRYFFNSPTISAPPSRVRWMIAFMRSFVVHPILMRSGIGIPATAE